MARRAQKTTNESAERTHPRTSARGAHLLTMLALTVATLAVYAQIRHHTFLTYDDPDYVLQNPNLRLDLGWEGVRQAFTRPFPIWDWVPLTSLSLQVDYALYGLDPSGYLITNVALHVLATLVLYAAFVRMTGARGRSAFVAAVFALHPLHVESVAWASERKDVLSGLFFVLALWAYASYAERPRIARFLVVTLCLLLGLLSKATLVTLPAVFLLLDWWPLGRLGAGTPAGPGVRVTLRRAVLEKIPMLLLVAGVASIIFAVGRAAGAMHSLDALPLGVRVGNALESYVLYAAKSVWPSGLAVLYPLRVGPPPLGPSLAAALCLTLVSLLVARHARTRPYLAVGWFWYLGMLVPTIGLVQVGMQARADRFMYLPLIGLSILIAWGASDVFDRLRARRFAGPAALAVLASLWVCTWLQIQHWQNSFTLFEHAIEVTQKNSVAHLNLGSAFLATGDADAAERHYARAAVIDPKRIQARLGLADVLALRGDLGGAIAAYERVLKTKPDDPLASGRYGVTLLRAGRIAQAQRPLEIAVAAHPGSTLQHTALAVVYAELGRRRDAIASNRAALRLDPTQQRATNNLAWLLATSADASLAERQESVRLAERAARTRDEQDPSMLDTLGTAYAAVGRFEEAIAVATRAARSAEASRQPQLAREIRARGAHYASHRAWVEPAPGGASDSAASSANAATPIPGRRMAAFTDYPPHRSHR